MKPKVYISYTKADKDFVDILTVELQKNNINYWIDEKDILVGNSIPGKIGKGLKSSDFVCPILSNNSITRIWVKREIEAGITLKLKEEALFPLRIDKCEIPAYLEGIKYANCSKNWKKGISDLVRTIKEKFRRLRK